MKDQNEPRSNKYGRKRPYTVTVIYDLNTGPCIVDYIHGVLFVLTEPKYHLFLIRVQDEMQAFWFSLSVQKTPCKRELINNSSYYLLPRNS